MTDTLKAKYFSWHQITWWRTADEEMIPIDMMETSHLANTIAMIRRQDTPNYRMRLAFTIPCPMMNGDMAQHFAEVDWDREVDLAMTHGRPGYPLFRALVRQYTLNVIADHHARARMPQPADW